MTLQFGSLNPPWAGFVCVAATLVAGYFGYDLEFGIAAPVDTYKSEARRFNIDKSCRQYFL